MVGLGRTRSAIHIADTRCVVVVALPKADYATRDGCTVRSDEQADDVDDAVDDGVLFCDVRLRFGDLFPDFQPGRHLAILSLPSTLYGCHAPGIR